MLDALALPLLLKSIDFIYSEYSKLLDERRERREEARGKARGKADKEKKVELAESPILRKDITSKEDALKTPVDPALWKKDEEEIRHLVSLLEIHYDNYYLLKKQYAQWTAALVPSVIASSLAYEENQIEETTQALKKLVGEVYATNVNAGDLSE